jgi:cobyrinic acid a,c-diamide synthase
LGNHVDIDALLALAKPPSIRSLESILPVPVLGQRVAVAQDSAFAFAYGFVLDGWRNAGVELTQFSPLANESPDARANAVYLPGGYPELHACAIAANHRFLKGLRDAAHGGAIIYGECGGYMTLGRGLIDAEGERHAMAGLLPVETSFAEPRMTLGYREVEVAARGPLGLEGTRFRGHEFHFARLLSGEGEEDLFNCFDASGRPLGASGCRVGSVMGSFIHLIDHCESGRESQ